MVVLAAGDGSRLGGQVPKALVVVAGRTLLEHTLAGLAAAGLPPAVVLYPPGCRDEVVTAVGRLPVAEFVEGGGTRTESVRIGVGAVSRSTHLVVIHEAARPLMPSEAIRRTVAAVRDDDEVVAAAPGLPVSDMLKRIDAHATVLATVGRDRLVEIQTPQVMPRVALEEALATDDGTTDDLGLIEAMVATGELTGRVRVVEGSIFGRKVTFPEDLAVIAALASAALPGREPERPSDVAGVSHRDGARPGGGTT